MCMYVHIYMYVWVYVFSASDITHTHTLETKHWDAGPIWIALPYAFRIFWRFDLQGYKKINSNMLQFYNAEVATLI